METSTTHGSVAVLGPEGALLFEDRFIADRTHSSHLFAALERARRETPPWQQIVVGLGPGSYAGIRIAISAGMGMAMSTGAQLLGLPSVAALEVEPACYVAIGDARRDSFYWTSVDHGVCREGPELVTAEDLHARLAANTLPVFASDALAKDSVALAHPTAARLAQHAAAARGLTARDQLEPIYLREPHITRPKA